MILLGYLFPIMSHLLAFEVQLTVTSMTGTSFVIHRATVEECRDGGELPLFTSSMAPPPGLRHKTTPKWGIKRPLLGNKTTPFVKTTPLDG